jgi:hypothetical protein
MANTSLPAHELRWIIRQLERIARKNPRKAAPDPPLLGFGSSFTAIARGATGSGEMYDRIVLRAIARRLKEAQPQISNSKPRSWRPRFPYWRRMMEQEGRTLADIMRSEQVPEGQRDSVRRSYERYSEDRYDK